MTPEANYGLHFAPFPYLHGGTCPPFTGLSVVLFSGVPIPKIPSEILSALLGSLNPHFEAEVLYPDKIDLKIINLKFLFDS